jgi:hypothetical protein
MCLKICYYSFFGKFLKLKGRMNGIRTDEVVFRSFSLGAVTTPSQKSKTFWVFVAQV